MKTAHLTYRDVQCPACHSRGRHCHGGLVRTAGKYGWHDERIQKFSELCGCPECKAYLEKVA